MRIGIPQALLYYYYMPLWRGLFEALGCEVVFSGNTNKEIVNQGVKVSVPEICVPIKIFNGHVIELSKKNVDYIFVPRMVTVEDGLTFCPKFLGLPDMVRFTFPELAGKVISPDIRDSHDNLADLDAWRSDPFFAKFPHWQLRDAMLTAQEDWQKFLAICRRGYLASEALKLYRKPVMPDVRERKEDVTIGLIGYVYDVYDPFVSMEIGKKLQDLAANVITFEMLPDEAIQQEIAPMRKTLFWTFSNKVLGAGQHFFKDDQVDGIIHVTAFGCGPDSLVGKFQEIDSDDYQKPFMTIRVDEHTGENHLQTRIEAFVDMLKKKKRKNSSA